MQVCMYACMYAACASIFVCMYVYMYIRIYINTYTHAYIYTNTYRVYKMLVFISHEQISLNTYSYIHMQICFRYKGKKPFEAQAYIITVSVRLLKTNMAP